MPRRRRDDVPNSIHHVIQRGNNRTYIYEDTRDKRQFLSILSEALEHYGATLLHYVLMDNHYHLLLRLGAHPLSQLIWYVNRHYTLYYNRRYNRIGTIYGGRFLSYLMAEQAKLYSTVRYIVRNPVKAQMVDEPSRYRWSGHKAVLDGDRASSIAKNCSSASHRNPPSLWRDTGNVPRAPPGAPRSASPRSSTAPGRPRSAFPASSTVSLPNATCR